MPTVQFESDFVETVTVDAPDGGDLGAICDDVMAPIPFGCRSANCGTCRVVVLEGASHLAPAKDEEIDLLEIFAAPPTHRLACCAVILKGEGRIKLRAVRDDE